MKKNKIAIIYDFDETLIKGNIQESSFLPTLGIDKKEFWKEIKEKAKRNNMSEILACMYIIIEKGSNITKKNIKIHGEKVELFNGVEEYFEKINEYVKKLNICVEHYIVSSGTKEMIEGTKITKYFKYIFACSFLYDDNNRPVWPAVAIDYTSKTQYLFRINKGIINCWDNSEINKYIPEKEREIPFKNMIYIGDGDTDIPAMKMINYKGGTSIAVYPPNEKNEEKKRKAKELLENKRVNYVVAADYSENSDLYKIIKLTIDQISIQNKLHKLKNNMI